MMPDVLAELSRMPKEAFEVDALIDDGKDQAVENRDTCALSGGEDTGDRVPPMTDETETARRQTVLAMLWLWSMPVAFMPAFLRR